MKTKTVILSMLALVLVGLNYQFVIPNIKKGGDPAKKQIEKKKQVDKKEEKKKKLKKQSSYKSKKIARYEAANGVQKFSSYDTTAQDSFYWAEFGRGSFKVYKKEMEQNP